MTTTTSNGGGVLLSALMHEFNLEVLYASDDIEKIVISSDDINRPGLQLAGFFDHFDAGNLQIIGRTEETFLERFTQERRRAAFENLFKRKIPALIFSRNMEPFPECLEIARKYDVTVLRSPEWTSTLMGDMLSTLRVWLAPRITRHGVLVEVYGEGILILGDSGIGKSETAIELVKRGHRLIADDAVEISKVSNHTLVGTAPEVIRHYIELRGIGVRIVGLGETCHFQDLRIGIAHRLVQTHAQGGQQRFVELDAHPGPEARRYVADVVVDALDEGVGEVADRAPVGEHPVTGGQLHRGGERPRAGDLHLEVVEGGAPRLFALVEVPGQAVPDPAGGQLGAVGHDPGARAPVDGDGLEQAGGPADRLGAQAPGGQLREVREGAGFAEDDIGGVDKRGAGHDAQAVGAHRVPQIVPEPSTTSPWPSGSGR